MANTIQCDIVSAEREIFSGQAELVVAHGSLGDLGIAPGHVALLTNLEPGPVRVYKENGEEEIFYVSGGFLEVQPSQVKVLADTALYGRDIDEAAAEAAVKSAEEVMAGKKGEFNYRTALVQLAEAAGQLRTLHQIRESKR